MAGEVTKTKTAYIQAPIDGLNLIGPPNQLAPTEARQLDNYLCLDWGIRQRANGWLETTFPGSSSNQVALIVPFVILAGLAPGKDALIVCSQKKFWRYFYFIGPAPTDITGSVTVTEDFTHYIIFNSRIFFFNGVDPSVYVDLLANSNALLTGFTGPTSPSSLLQPTTYKNRLYVTEKNTAKFWYGGVDAVTGPMVSFDCGAVFQRGGTIAVLTSWSFNQGIGSEEFLVVISNLGEVLVYSGDYPAATNWQLAGRTNIPRPVGTRAHLQVGQEVYVCTMRGVVALSRVFSGNTDDRYYIVSNKLGPNAYFADTQPAYNPDYPFLYFVGGGPAGSSTASRILYVLNYERGAWSRFTYRETILPPLSTTTISAAAVAFGSLYLGTGTDASRLYLFPDFGDGAGIVSGPDPLIWKTPFLGFGDGTVKSSKYVRVVARDMGTASIRNTVSIAADFKNTDIDSSGAPLPGSPLQPNQDTQTTPNPYPSGPVLETPHDWIVQELRPPGNGKTLSFVFSKTGATDLNEISGFEVMVESGGSY